MSVRLAEFVHRWRVLLTLFIVAGALALSPRAEFTRIDNDLTAWFLKSDPVYRDYDRLRDEFAGSRTLIVALEGKEIVSESGLDALRRIGSDIERIAPVERVYSLATANTVDAVGEGDEAGIEVTPLVPSIGPIDAALVRTRALDDPLIVGDLVSADATVVSLVINFDEDRIDAVRAETVERIRAVVRRHLPAGVTDHYNGSIEISETYNRVTIANTKKFIAPIVLLTVLALYAMFRSWRITILTMFAVLVSVLWTLGIYSLMGFTFNVLSGMLVPLVVVLAIADDVHIVQHYTEAARVGGDRAAAFKATIAHLALPLFAASGTTALGMFSLTTSQVNAVRTFGIGAGVGVMVDFVISLVLVPTLLTLVKPSTAPPPQERWLIGPMRRVAALSCRRPAQVMVAAGLLAAMALVGLARLRVDTNHINFFAASHPLSRSAAVIDRKLSGVYSFQVMFEGAPESMRDPGVLAQMDGFGQAMGGLPNVRKVVSIVDYLKRINRELNGGLPAWAVLPASRELIAQELLVFSLSDEGRRELEHVAASDYSKAQMTVRLASMSSDVVFEQVLRAQEMATTAFKHSGVTATVTGSGRLFAQLDHYLVKSQVSSFATAFFTVFGVIFIVFRSFKFGVLAILPNIFPVVVVLGVMGWLDISMNVATVMLASVALGIVDDDTIHFISRYRREVAAGRDTDTAIVLATVHEGRAAVTTAVINSCAFAVLLTSEYKPTAWFGGLLAVTMVVALLAEVFILPAVIKLAPRVFSAERIRGEPAPGTAPA